MQVRGRKEGVWGRVGGEGCMDGWIIDKTLLWCKTTFADGSNDTNPNVIKWAH